VTVINQKQMNSTELINNFIECKLAVESFKTQNEQVFPIHPQMQFKHQNIHPK